MQGARGSNPLSSTPPEPQVTHLLLFVSRLRLRHVLRHWSISGSNGQQAAPLPHVSVVGPLAFACRREQSSTEFDRPPDDLVPDEVALGGEHADPNREPLAAVGPGADHPHVRVTAGGGAGDRQGGVGRAVVDDEHLDRTWHAGLVVQIRLPASPAGALPGCRKGGSPTARSSPPSAAKAGRGTGPYGDGGVGSLLEVGDDDEVVGSLVEVGLVDVGGSVVVVVVVVVLVVVGDRQPVTQNTLYLVSAPWEPSAWMVSFTWTPWLG
jgi:hypothetical protein